MEIEAENKVSSQQISIDKVLEKINEIVKKSADGDYIYRGEPECYDKVSSSLYREYPHNIEGVYFDIEGLQDVILAEAKTYIGKTDHIDKTDHIGLLTEIQHFGGKTNLIDFTEDYLIALFFACDGSHDKEGRVILLKSESDNYETRKPGGTNNRVESQKSIFVESSTGFVEPDSVVTIPMDLKFPMLFHLEKVHRISIATIYNDLHGFIRRSATIELLKGLKSHGKAGKAKTHDKKHKHYENAVRHYTEAIKLKPDFAEAYNNRGAAYGDTRKFGEAIEDFNKSIDLDPENANAYNNRGAAYRNIDKFGTAIADLNEAIGLNPKDARFYSNRGNVYQSTNKFDAAIADFSKAIDLDPENANAYNGRGFVYLNKGNFGTAIADFSKAIDLDPENAGAYSNRGETWLYLKEWQKAKADLTTAKDMGHDIIASFHNDYESVEAFEAKNNVKVPKDIAALLSGNTT